MHMRSAIDMNMATGGYSISGGITNLIKLSSQTPVVISSNTMLSTFKKSSRRAISTHLHGLIPQKCKNFHPLPECDPGLEGEL